MTTIKYKYIRKILSQLHKEADKIDKEKYDLSRCAICGRKEGDHYTLTCTKYIKYPIRFKVRISLHKMQKNSYIALCDGHHLEYHLFERIAE